MSTVEIPLSRGYVAFVDAADASRVLAYKWSARSGNRTMYAHRTVRRADGRRTSQSLHQFLTGYAITDHINGNGLDNRRSNLREATPAQNGQNRRRGLDNRSGFKGVSWNARDRKWQAHIRVNGPQRSLGYYETAEEAAQAYDAAARDLHGEYAALNFPAPGERAA